MLGAEFIVHGAQQKAKMTVADKDFPGMSAAGDGFEMMEEWYTLKDHAKNLHVLLIQEPGLKGNMYDRPAYPATWARMHGKGASSTPRWAIAKRSGSTRSSSPSSSAASPGRSATSRPT